MSSMSALVLVLAIASIAATPGTSAVLDDDDIETLFSIRKSQNRNRVDYGLRIDTSCDPTGNAPVVPYWRMLEHGPHVTESLARRERRAYGLEAQSVERTPRGTRVRIRLRALGERPVSVGVQSDASGCSAYATVSISGVPSVIADIFVVLRTSVSIDHVELRGRSLLDSAPTYERLEP